MLEYPLESRRGEIGIHDRLKIYWGQLRKGASPFAGMFFNPAAVTPPVFNLSKLQK